MKRHINILVVGAGRSGGAVIRQLKKNPGISVFTADARDELYAVAEKIIDKVDIAEPVTPLNIDEIIAKYHPDLILLALPTEEMGLGKSAGVDILADALRDELSAVANVPVIEVARRAGDF